MSIAATTTPDWSLAACAGHADLYDAADDEAVQIRRTVARRVPKASIRPVRKIRLSSSVKKVEPKVTPEPVAVSKPVQKPLSATELCQLICQSCPIKSACTSYGLEVDNEYTPYSVWGGLNKSQRRTLRS